jgi:hypothetical protein
MALCLQSYCRHKDLQCMGSMKSLYSIGDYAMPKNNTVKGWSRFLSLLTSKQKFLISLMFCVSVGGTGCRAFTAQSPQAQDSQVAGTPLKGLSDANGYGGLIPCNRRIKVNGLYEFQDTFTAFHIRAKREKREALILPDLRPESVGNFTVMYRDSEPQPIDFINHLSTGSWFTTNRTIEKMPDHFKSKNSHIMNLWTLGGTGYGPTGNSPVAGNRNGYVQIVMDPIKKRVYTMNINGGGGFRPDHNLFPQFFFDLSDTPVQASSFPRVGDDAYVLFRADCEKELTTTILAPIKISRILQTNRKSNKDLLTLKLKARIEPSTAGTSRECMEYSSVFDAEGKLYGMVTHYKNDTSLLDPENLEITSIHDERLKAYIRDAYMPDSRGSRGIFEGRDLIPEDKNLIRWSVAQADFWACAEDEDYLDKLALQMAEWSLTKDYNTKPTCSPEELKTEFIKAKKAIWANMEKTAKSVDQKEMEKCKRNGSAYKPISLTTPKDFNSTPLLCSGNKRKPQ